MKKLKLQLANEEYDVGYITSREEAQKALALLEELYPEDSTDIIGLDIETYPLPEYAEHGKAGLSPQLSGIATLQLYLPNEKTVFVFHVNRVKDWVALFKDFLETRNFVAHYAQFDLQHLIWNGIIPREKSIGCSRMLFQLLLFAIHPEPKKVRTTLVQMAKTALGVELDKSEQVGGWQNEELTDNQILYAAADAVCTQRCALWAAEKMTEYGMTDLARFYRLNKLAQVALAQMSLNGVKIDIPYHNRLIAQWEKDEITASKQVKEILPENLNLRSPKQMSAWLTSELSKTPDGLEDLAEWPTSEKTPNLKCDADTLSMFGDLPFVAPLLDYKVAAKMSSTYGKSLQNCVNPRTGRIHSSFTQCHTATGRLSSMEPNCQNFPRDKEFRDLFIPEEGNIIVRADFNQIEVRIFAYHSGEQILIDGFERGADSYLLTAALLLGKPESQVTKAERQAIKAVFLGRLFLLGAKKLVRYAWSTFGLKITFENAKEIIKLIDTRLASGRKWQLKTTDEASRTLQATSRMGKIRRLPEDRYYNTSVNHPVQSDAAACMLYSLIRMQNWIYDNNPQAKLILTVHDELLVECPEKDVKQVAAALKNCMEQGVLDVFPEASLKGLVDPTIGKTWGQAKD